MSFTEIIASVLGLISVWLVTKQNIWCWPIGIAMVLLYIFIFYEARLYSDMLLQIFFAMMQIYGWYFWLNGKREEIPFHVSYLKRKEIIFWTFSLVVFSVPLGWLMKTFTDAALPYIDAGTTAMSVTAQWLMTKKIIENWILWIVADVIYVGMYFYKALYPTALLYLIFLVLACWGYVEWKKSFEKERAAF